MARTATPPTPAAPTLRTLFSGGSNDEVQARARRATEAMRKMEGQLSAFARSLTGRDDIRVVVAPVDPCTDGKVIYLRPPIELGDSHDHERTLCDTRNEHGEMLCPACAAREDVLITLYHEIAHIAYGSFQVVSDKDKALVIKRALKEAGLKTGSKRATALAERLEKARITSYMEAAHAVSPFLPMLVNALEDVRVNRAMYRARPGTLDMFRGQSHRVFTRGIEGEDGTVHRWNEAGRNAQAVVGVFAKAAGYSYHGWFIDEVEQMLDDPDLKVILQRLDTVRSARGVYELAFPTLEFLRSKGFCKGPEDEPDDEPEPEPEPPQPEPDDSDEEPEPGDEPGNPGDTEDSDDNDGDPTPGDTPQDDDGDAPEGDDPDDTPQDPDDGDDTPSDDPEGDDSTPADDGDDTPQDGDDGDDGEGDDSDDESGDDGADPGEGEDPGDDAGEGDDEPGEGDDQEDPQGGDGDEPGDTPDDEGEPGDTPTDTPGGEPGSTPSGPSIPEDDDPVAPEPEPVDDSDEVELLLRIFGQHDEHDPTEDEVQEAQELDRAVVQGEHFDQPSSEIFGVRVHRWGTPTICAGGQNLDLRGAWSGNYSSYYGEPPKIVVPEEIISPALLRMRKVFSDNAKEKMERNLRSGRVNTRALGKRLPVGDDRLFQKRSVNTKKDYFVVIGLDVSGSTAGRNISIIKAAAAAQAELLHRLGVGFAVYAHTGELHDSRTYGGYDVDLYAIKEAHEPWDTPTRERLDALGPSACNLDGHTLEFYRKVLDSRQETDRIILYYTDGAMPCENYEEELSVLQREIKVCQQKGYTLLGVGIRNDEPRQYGLDTVQIDNVKETMKVVEHLEKRLLED